MVRILCLHGVGTNADILKTQTASLLAALPNHFEWQFVDGEEECAPAPGVQGIFPPPFLCYHLEPSCENIREAVELMDDIIDTEGPFDAVLGFSQGGALAATMIVRHQTLKPFEPPPFRVAVFLCSNLPFSWDASYGYDVTSLLVKGRSSSIDFDEWKAAAASAPVKGQTEAYLNDLPESIQQRIREKADALGDADIPPCRRFHPQMMKEKISIPTVHLYGLKDEYYEQSLALVDICEKSVAQSVQHPGGHEIPRDRESTKAICDAIQRAITRAELMM